MLEESRAFHHFLADLRDLVNACQDNKEHCSLLIVLIFVLFVVFVINAALVSWDGCMISTRGTLRRSLPGVWQRLNIF